MTTAIHDRFTPAMPQKYRARHATKYRAQYYAAIALVVMIAYVVQLMLGISEYSHLKDQRNSDLPFAGFHVQNTSLAYRN